MNLKLEKPEDKTDDATTSMAARHSSKSAEHYTPPAILEPARALLGGIDLDPASCAIANAMVRAKSYFIEADNGFLKKWSGKVFLNPPGGFCDTQGLRVIKRTKKTPPCTESGACGIPAPHKHDACLSSQKAWWQKIARKWASAEIEAAVFLCFSIELLQTTQSDTPAGLTIPLHFPICFPRARVCYLYEEDGMLVEGDNPPHSSAVIFMPPIEPRLRSSTTLVGLECGQKDGFAQEMRDVFSTVGYVK
jgi:hypothetical protein